MISSSLRSGLLTPPAQAVVRSTAGRREPADPWRVARPAISKNGAERGSVTIDASQVARGEAQKRSSEGSLGRHREKPRPPERESELRGAAQQVRRGPGARTRKDAHKAASVFAPSPPDL